MKEYKIVYYRIERNMALHRNYVTGKEPRFSMKKRPWYINVILADEKSALMYDGNHLVDVSDMPKVGLGFSPPKNPTDELLDRVHEYVFGL